MSLECKHYKPGDTDFEEIAKQITPIERISNGKHSNFIFAEVDPQHKVNVRRKENVN